MTDNSGKYPDLGYDLFQGNDMNDNGWALLRPTTRFFYLRAAIGLETDPKFLEFFGHAFANGFAVGAFTEQWPGIGAAAHIRTLLAGTGGVKLDLPYVVAYEQEPLRDKHRGWVWTWPEAGTTDSIVKTFPGQCIIYTNLDGLDHLRAGGLDLRKYQYWIARYYDHSADGEMGVDDTLALLLSDYGIQPEQVLFMQTSKQGTYPTGVSPDLGADIDRAVAWSFQPAPPPVVTPPPATTPAGFLHMIHEDGQQEDVNYFHPSPISTIVDSVTRLQYNPPATTPEPPPVVPPVVVGPTLNLYMLKRMFDRPGAPSDPFNKPDVENGGGGSVVDLTAGLQWFWFGLLRSYAPAWMNDEDLKRAWRNLTASNRAFTNDKGTDKFRDYISGRNMTEEDPAIGKFYSCGWNPLNVLDDKHPVKFAGIPHFKVQAIDPKAHDINSSSYNRKDTPYLIHFADICYSRTNEGPFPQLDGNDVPYPVLGVGGVGYMRVDCLVKWEGDIPSPYLPPRS